MDPIEDSIFAWECFAYEDGSLFHDRFTSRLFLPQNRHFKPGERK